MISGAMFQKWPVVVREGTGDTPIPSNSAGFTASVMTKGLEARTPAYGVQ